MRVARNIYLLSWFNFWADFRPYAPIAILYYSQVTGSYALGMSVFSAAMLAQSLFEMPTGVLSDIVGRKKTVVYGAVAGVFALTFYAIGGTYWALLVGAIFEGLGRAFYSGNNDALLYDTLAEMEQRETFQEYLGKTSSMYQLALAISAVIGSVIAAISFHAAMVVSIIPMVLALVVSIRLIEPGVHMGENTNIYAHLKTALRNFKQNARLRSLSLAGILSYAIGESSWVIRSAFIVTLWPVWAIGIAQMIGNVTAALSSYYAGRIIKRFGEFKLLVGGMSISEGINLVCLLIPTVLSPALMASNSIFHGVNTVAKQSLIQHEFSDEQRATMGSLNSFVGSIAFSVFSFLLGGLADRIGIVPALVTTSLLSIVPMTLYFRVLRPRAGEMAASNVVEIVS
ncbi:MAG: MFS transporter [Anaerolineae bacterium]|nr:MFS transporter [Anaerolineae bacterium]